MSYFGAHHVGVAMAVEELEVAGYRVMFDPDDYLARFEFEPVGREGPSLTLHQTEALRLATWISDMVRESMYLEIQRLQDRP